MPQLRPAIVLTSVLALGASAVILKGTRAADSPARPRQAQNIAETARSSEGVAVSRGVRMPGLDVAPTAGTASTATFAAGPPKPDGTSPAGGKQGASKPVPPGAPQVPEESATIPDDPTIAPDPKQSADNNVSFPNDI